VSKQSSVTYDPPQNVGHPQKVTWGGLDFEAGKSVPVTDARMVEKARHNPFFRVTGEGPQTKEAADSPEHAMQLARKFEEQMDAAVDMDVHRDHTAELASRANEQRKRGRPVILKDRSYVRNAADGLA
jgi:hypothetical protein